VRDAGELPRQPALELPALAPGAWRWLLGLVAALLMAAPAAAQPPVSSAGSTAPDPGVLIAPRSLDVPPAGRRLAARRVLRIAEAVPKIAAVKREHPGSYSRAFLKGTRQWQVSTYRRQPGRDEEIGQVFVDDRTGGVLEAWTGIQVAWTMARGYEGAFGRRINAPWVWLPLLALFLLPFLRPPWRLVHLDVLVLAAFSLSYLFFCRGEIGLSVPLAYPPLAYLLVRMLLLARHRGRPGGDAARSPLRLLVGAGFLSVAIVFLLGFRIGLNVTTSNVIDVGYAGTIGADRIVDGDGVYGRFPKDNRHGDTYGPVNYYAYIPFEQVAPWTSGTWDALPSAHAAAVAFDLLCVLLLWLLGNRLRGPRLGLLLPYLWLTFPFTLVVANSNANDALVGGLALGALLLAARPAARGAAIAVAGLAKFAPLAMAPLLATYRHGPRGMLVTTAAFAVVAALVLAPVALLDGGLGNFFERTLLFQADRESPFSVWGYWNLDAAQKVVQVAGVLLAVALAFVPRRRDLVSLCALSAAVLIALQLGISHWFYLYLVWFLPMLLAASLGEYDDPDDIGRGH
jgi:hypothetical protein